MNVQVDRVLEDGTYDAVLDGVEMKETKYGERLMWTFRIPSEDATTVIGFTSMSPSTKAHAYTWAAAIMGDIDPKIGWGPEDVIGGKCRVVLGTYEDAQGVEKNKVEKVLRAKAKAEAKAQEVEGDFEEFPF
ncbi:MAG: hypothetical protein M3334_08385 [Actinomycetota bacterium]|nr:hypothetical protein [Actinomycetota bacterium]